MNNHYFLTDIRRLFKSGGLYASVVGVAASMFFSMERIGLVNDNVLFSFVYATEMSGMMIAYVFCALPYAASFCDDLEYQYIRYQAVRGSLKHYVASKVSVIYLSSAAVMVCGSLLFVSLCYAMGPWEGPGSTQLYESGAFHELAQRGHYMSYCGLYALQLGFLAGILSVMAAFFSMYITNKVMVFALPVLIYKILIDVSGTGKYTVFVFRAGNRVMPGDWQNLLCLFAVSAGAVCVIALGIYRKLKKRM